MPARDPRHRRSFFIRLVSSPLSPFHFLPPPLLSAIPRLYPRERGLREPSLRAFSSRRSFPVPTRETSNEQFHYCLTPVINLCERRPFPPELSRSLSISANPLPYTLRKPGPRVSLRSHPAPFLPSLVLAAQLFGNSRSVPALSSDSLDLISSFFFSFVFSSFSFFSFSKLLFLPR